MIYGKYTDIKVTDLTIGSNYQIEATCDVCNGIKKISYKIYINQTSNQNIFACSHKCKVEKIKKTKQLRYGSPGYSNQEKAKITKVKRYGSYSYNNQEKIKRTNQERYGVDNTYQSEIYKEKSKSTKKNLYGNENYTNPEKTKYTKKERYGDEKFNNAEMMKLTKSKRYGNCSYNNREKAKQSCLDKFGVDNPMKSEIIFEKSLDTGRRVKLHEKTNLKYQGGYELDFLDNYCDILDIEKGPKVFYTFKNKQKTYFSDYFIPKLNLIIEIKSRWWFNKHFKINTEKQKSALKEGFNFIFIIDRNYEELNNLIKKYG
jgi:hypothetical protein